MKHPSSRNHYQAAIMTVAGGLTLIAFTIVVLVVTTPAKVAYKPLPCDQQYDELRTVAKISTATGQLPGQVSGHDSSGEPVPVGTEYSVNPNFCEAK